MASRLISRKTQALKEVGQIENARLLDFGARAVEMAKRPPPEGSPHDTGNNRDNIGFEPIREMVIRIFTKSGYGAYLELGTANIAGTFYMLRGIIDAAKDMGIKTREART